MSTKPKSPTRTLTKRYILGLSAVALLSISGQVAIQLSIKHQSSDAVTINVAGRQRMLSQKLAKASLAIQTSTNATITNRYVRELEEVADLWAKSHRGLQVGDPELGLPGNNSAKVELLFAEIQAAHETMLAAAKGILAVAKTQPNSPADSPDFSRLIGQILEQEPYFVQGMDTIVGQYQQEAEVRVARISQIELWLLSITLVVLILEAILIFRPAVRQIHRYITELQAQEAKAAELSAELERQNTQLETSLESAYSATRFKSEFLANMSHELLTPMNAAIAMTGLLRQTQLNPQQQDWVQTIHQSSENLLQMIRDLLDFAKIEAGKLELESKPFDLRQCVEASLEVVAADAANRELDLAYTIAPQTAVQVFGDYSRLQQILVNLLDNAVKFTDRGEIVVCVTAKDLGNWSIPGDDREDKLSPIHQYQEIQFSVQDTGIGIPEDKIDRLFRSFSQIDGSNVREYGGLGLGLAISQRLTELMAGRLWVESQPGVGSTFSFTIAAAVVPDVTDPLTQVQPSLQGKRLLIVDDRATTRQHIRQLTEMWGMICVDVATGAEALDCIRQGNQFDLALLDLQMPQMDGLSLGRLIHQENRLPNLQLVMMSAIGCPVKLSDSDFVACLSKPIKISQLYQTIVNLLGPSPQPQTEKSPAPTPAKLADRLPWRILVAEDNVVNQKVALRLLSRLGYKADVAKNGLEAIAALEQKPYDLVLMDIQMPKMDGLEATRQICQQWGDDISADYATEKKPWIIAVTAGGTDGDRHQCLAAGMDDYLTKPINLELLQTTLEQLGERSSAEEIGQQDVTVNSTSNGSKPTSPKHMVSLDWKILENLRQELASAEDTDLIKEIIDLFLENTPSLLADIHAAVQAQNSTILKYTVHTLKGSASNLGLRKMYHLCMQLQELGDRGSFDDAIELFSNLEAEFILVKAAFKSQANHHS